MYSVIIPAAGRGARMGLAHNKLFYKVSQHTIIEHTVHTFTTDEKCKQIILTVSHADLEKMKEIFANDPAIKIVIGGETRQASIYNALEWVTEEIVLVHDGARPFVSADLIGACYDVAKKGFGAISAVMPKDTVKQQSGGIINKTLSRDQLVMVQTPQAFPTALLKRANQLAGNNLNLETDDASLVEKYTDVDIRVVEGDYKNIKFTTPEDIEYFKFLMKERK